MGVTYRYHASCPSSICAARSGFFILDDAMVFTSYMPLYAKGAGALTARTSAACSVDERCSADWYESLASDHRTRRAEHVGRNDVLGRKAWCKVTLGPLAQAAADNAWDEAFDHICASLPRPG
jgi:hypothetical protein